MRRIPVISTALVLAAVGVMVWLGFWQISRLHQKEALLARYAAARSSRAVVEWPEDPKKALDLLYRHARLDCLRVTDRGAMAGRNTRQEPGLAQSVQCALPGGGTAKVILGWSREPVAARDWTGGEVRGVIAPGPRLVADPPLAGLQANEAPDPAEIPNNHLSYAVQWFLFAATALIVYAIALRRRWAA